MGSQNKIELHLFLGTIFLQLILFAVCITGVSGIIFTRVMDKCPKWVWREPVALLVQLFKKPFSPVFYEKEQIFSHVSGSILIAIPLISVACGFIIVGFLYFKLFYFLERIAEKSEKSKTPTEARS